MVRDLCFQVPVVKSVDIRQIWSQTNLTLPIRAISSNNFSGPILLSIRWGSWYLPGWVIVRIPWDSDGWYLTGTQILFPRYPTLPHRYQTRLPMAITRDTSTGIHVGGWIEPHKLLTLVLMTDWPVLKHFWLQGKIHFYTTPTGDTGVGGRVSLCPWKEKLSEQQCLT